MYVSTTQLHTALASNSINAEVPNLCSAECRGSQPVLCGALRAPRALPRGSAAVPGK